MSIKYDDCKCCYIPCVYAGKDRKFDCVHSVSKTKPESNADRFRTMSDDEQQNCVRKFWEIEDFANWLKQPFEGE